MLLVTAAILMVSSPALGQRSIATERDTILFELPTLQVMLDSARALFRDLQEDPRVLYSTGFGPPAEVMSASAAYPWNAVSPTSDSTVNVIMPGNLREADRAYYNYAVMRMRVVRGQDPDESCGLLIQAEEKVLSSYVDGWIVARTLFGGPAFEPMDELVFAREAGLLRPLLAARENVSIGVCAEQWAAEHPDEIAAYESWSAQAFPGLGNVVPEPDADVEDSEPEAEVPTPSEVEEPAEN
jgi:hypothetical protein